MEPLKKLVQPARSKTVTLVSCATDDAHTHAVVPAEVTAHRQTHEPRNGSGSSCSIAKYEAERFFHCSAVHQRGEYINDLKWLRYIVIARFRLFQLPFLG
jgi:hypothetical protein